MSTSIADLILSVMAEQQQITPQWGGIEPHSMLLRQPGDGQLLYKVITVENLLRSIDGGYLHFNRVDSYADFPGADHHDGEQLPADRASNETAIFQATPDFSAANYYDLARQRTYACCFSLENSSYIWTNYANGGTKGKLCVVFDFAKLRGILNESLAPENARLLYNGERCHQLFYLNYGIVDYVPWDRHRSNAERLPNPIIYSYLKAEEFKKEAEFRITLSAFGMGRFVLNNGNELTFPPTLQASFAFGPAMEKGAIRQILFGQDCDRNLLCEELGRRGITPGPGSDLLRV